MRPPGDAPRVVERRWVEDDPRVVDVPRLPDCPAVDEGRRIGEGSGAAGLHVDGGTEVAGDRVKCPCASRASLLELCSLRSAIIVAPYLCLPSYGKGWDNGRRWWFCVSIVDFLLEKYREEGIPLQLKLSS